MVAQMMNKTFSVAKTWKEYPNGCYIFSDNRVYFNHHLTGQSNELCCPICYIPGSSGIYIQSLLKIESKCISAWKIEFIHAIIFHWISIANGVRYGQAGLGKSDCSSISAASVASFRECKHSGVSLGITFKGIETDKGYPKGCYVYMGKVVVWNNHGTGGTNNDATPVCKMN